jgi:NAD(P)-dependent dehydrogenase (short-subunit alcohol dehydrogenase family)
MKQQKVWLITGASRGFGFDITKAALEAGDKVVATVRNNPEKLEEQLGHPGNLLVTVLDVTSEEQVKAGVQKGIDRFGQIDVLVNNAGYGLLGATEEISDAEARAQFDTNVFGLLNVTRALLPHMRSRKSGHIINISSLFGYGATVPGLGLYGATKFAVEGITEGLAQELKPLGIRVTAAAPGLFSTEFASANSFRNSALVLDAYEPTVGQARLAIKGLHGNQPGDPSKLAQVLLRIAGEEQPPVHLPIGKDAVSLVRAKAISTEQEVATWETLTTATDHVKG